MGVELDAQGLCRVIKALKSAEVSKFRMEGLEIEFSTSQPDKLCDTIPNEVFKPRPQTKAEDTDQLTLLPEVDEDLEELEMAILDPGEWQRRALQESDRSSAVEGELYEEA